MVIRVLKPKDITPPVIEKVNNLLYQENPKLKKLSKVDLESIVSQKSARLLVAWEDSELVGMLTAVCYRCPSKICVAVEDVVVDQNYRRWGIGRALVNEAIEWARKMGASKVDLTSSMEKEAAHAFYESLGFEIRQTYPYRFYL